MNIGSTIIRRIIKEHNFNSIRYLIDNYHYYYALLLRYSEPSQKSIHTKYKSIVCVTFFFFLYFRANVK